MLPRREDGVHKGAADAAGASSYCHGDHVWSVGIMQMCVGICLFFRWV